MDKMNNKMLIAEGFHTTDILCVYEIETGRMEWIDAEELTQYSGNLTEELKRRDIRYIITNEMSFMALGLFLDGGFTVWKSRGNDLLYNLTHFKNGELDLFTVNSSFKKSSCVGESCHSCNEVCKN